MPEGHDDSVREAVRDALSRDAAQRVWVGFSGGLDSTVLLDAAVRVTDAPIAAVHVNHHLHADSDRWAWHCRDVCRGLGVECIVRDVTVERRGSVEQAARTARYAVFEGLVAPGDVVLLGHHADDQSETVLFRLLRGSAARPGGMVARRSLGAGTLVRPLLALSRADLEAYADDRGLRWLEDPTNADTVHDRNFLRHRVVPRLRERWPDAVSRIVRAAGRQARDAELLEELLDRELAGLVVDGALDGARLRAFAAPARLLRHWLEQRGVHGTSERALTEFLRQVDAASSSPELGLADGRTLRAYAGRIHLVAERRPERRARRLTLGAGPGPVVVRLAHGCITARRAHAPGLRDGDYCVRLRGGGERMRESADRSRTVKRLLADARVVPWQRQDYPLVCADGDVVAVPGIAIAAQWLVDDGWQLTWAPEG